MSTPKISITDTQPLLFDDLGPRRVVADFSGGHLSSDGGALLLRQIDRSLGVSRNLAKCFIDRRDPRWVEHAVEALCTQRVQGMALGYEDLNDHQDLRRDPLLAISAGKGEPLGNPLGEAVLAAPSTLNRMELGNERESRAHKIEHDPAKVEACVLELGVRCLPKHAKEIVLDLDSMGHLVHGLQEGRHFSAYYDGYCYLPLYVVCGSVVLWAQLRTADQDGAEGAVPALEKIVVAIRRRCRKARIIVRGDSGFCREDLMAWCEGQREVYHVLGLSQNARLLAWADEAMVRARTRQCLCGGSVREFTEFFYQTHKTWSRARRVVAKAEVTAQGDNPRFVVTSLPATGFRGDTDRRRFVADRLYEETYCGRGNMENILKQQVLDLPADRLSTHYLGSNQLRLWFATLAYLLLERLRALTLQGTQLANATVGTIRQQLLKVAAHVTVSVRRVYIRLCSAFPRRELFGLCHQRLMALAPQTG